MKIATRKYLVQQGAIPMARDARASGRGRIGIFNRSYYEEMIVVQVHPKLFGAEGVTAAATSHDKMWHGRYRSINAFETHLNRSGMHIVKFFLHLSDEEQRKRLVARLGDPQKQWKFQATNVEECNH